MKGIIFYSTFPCLVLPLTFIEGHPEIKQSDKEDITEWLQNKRDHESDQKALIKATQHRAKLRRLKEKAIVVAKREQNKRELSFQNPPELDSFVKRHS